MNTKVLFVDDEPDVEVMMRQRFRRKQDIDLLFASDGASALQALREHREVGLVVSDINMPVMDGLTMLGEVQTLDRPVKVVVVSAYGDIDNIRSAMNRGAFDFVTKPIDFHDLSVTIDKARNELTRLKEGQLAQKQLSVLQTELAVASRIQHSMLPQTFPAFPGRKDFDIHAEMIAARSVGGDFYDFFLIDEHRLAVFVGDVSGKGVPAALFMSSARALLRAIAKQGHGPGECVTIVNSILYRESDPSMFLTLFYGVLDLQTGVLECTLGGHNPPVLFGPSAPASFAKLSPELIVGALDGIHFDTQRIELVPGSGLLLYTDGISEAETGDYKEYSEQKLLDTVDAVRDGTSRELCMHVLESVRTHADGAEQSDDMTLLALRYHGH